MVAEETAVAVGQPEPAMGMPVPQAGPVKPGFVTIPLRVVPAAGGGGLHVEEGTYTLALQNVISRAELDAIVAELNATCERHAPSVTAHKALRVLVPVVGCEMAPPMLERKMVALKGELSATCSTIGQRGAKRGINLRVVDEPSSPPHVPKACRISAFDWHRCRRLRLAFDHAAVPHFRIDLEVAV